MEELLEHPESRWSHSAAGNGKRDGMKIHWIGQSAAEPHPVLRYGGEGSEAMYPLPVSGKDMVRTPAKAGEVSGNRNRLLSQFELPGINKKLPVLIDNRPVIVGKSKSPAAPTGSILVQRTNALSPVNQASGDMVLLRLLSMWRACDQEIDKGIKVTVSLDVPLEHRVSRSGRCGDSHNSAAVPGSNPFEKGNFIGTHVNGKFRPVGPLAATHAPSGDDNAPLRCKNAREVVVVMGVCHDDDYTPTACNTIDDEYINYWIQSGKSQAGLRPIIQERVSRQLTETLDLLIRNAFLSTSYMSLASSSYTGADQLTSSDKFTLDLVDDAILRAQTQNVWSAPVPGLQRGDLLCIGTPGQHYDVITSDASTNRWIELRKYADLTPFNQYELGSYHSSRHLFTNVNVLWNCGTTTKQSQIVAAATSLDGAPDPASTTVDGVYKVGQAGAAATHYITVQTNHGSAYSAGDIISIHKKKVQSSDVTANPKLCVLGAPMWNDAAKIERRIVSVSGDNLVLNKPLLVDYQTEVATTGTGVATPSSGCYGFVTKGLSLHVNIMIAEPNGVLCGVAVPPRVYAPDPIDLYQSVFRIGWDAYMKFQLVRPEAFEVFITAGTMREKGQKYN